MLDFYGDGSGYTATGILFNSELDLELYFNRHVKDPKYEIKFKAERRKHVTGL
jgi:hypothetical protein